ncbi:MAG: DUF5671 domain-containing protein [Glutamicibacter ardleyensis]|uniref:DUF5671 domain-containing protein n=1 Tax=Glutamicibacter ardleyensis TaxID=225894 RepID=UPI003F969944
MSMLSAPRSNQVVTSLRQLILHGLLFVLLMVLGSGLSTLITMALRGFVPTYPGSSEIAIGLSFTLIAGPLAWLLWRDLKEKIATLQPADSAIWTLQAASVYVISLAMSAVSFLRLCSELISPTRAADWQPLLGATLGWALIFIWQYRILKSPKFAPTQLPSLPGALGSAFALVLFALSAVVLVELALDEIISPQPTLIGPASALPSLFSATAWTAGAGLLWWWLWIVQRVHQAVDEFTDFLFVLLFLAIPGVLTLLSACLLLGLVLPLPGTAGLFSENLSTRAPLLLAAVLVGLMVWTYHQAKGASRPARVAEASRQLISGGALALGASGLGMVINALLAGLATSYASETSNNVLRYGLGLLIVGAIAWVYFFRPQRASDPASRRVYLVLFFGCSAVVALISLLVIAYRVFEFLLVTTGSGSLLDLVRAPFGWLIATVAVAVYHFALWRSDRARMSTETPQIPTPSAASTPLKTLMIVAPYGCEPLMDELLKLHSAQLHWIPRVGQPPEKEKLLALISEISTSFTTEPSGLMAVISPSGDIEFISLASPPVLAE